MSKDASKVVKAAEKFKKHSEKEMDRLRTLKDKSERLASLTESMPLAAQLIDRVKQKELQSSGDLIWIDQYLGQLRAEAAAKAASETPAAAGKDGEKKKKSKSK